MTEPRLARPTAAAVVEVAPACHHGRTAVTVEFVTVDVDGGRPREACLLGVAEQGDVAQAHAGAKAEPDQGGPQLRPRAVPGGATVEVQQLYPEYAPSYRHATWNASSDQTIETGFPGSAWVCGRPVVMWLAIFHWPATFVATTV